MPTDPADRPRHRGTAAAVLATCFALNMLGRGLGDTYTVFLVPIERDFGWSRAELTSVYSLYLVVSAIASPIVGMFFDRLGPRVVYGLGLACMGTAFTLAGSMTRLWQFYLLAGALVGVAVALTGMVPASGLLSRWYRARLSTAIGVVFAALGVGAISFIPMTQALVDRAGWRSAYHALGALLLALVPVVVFALPWRRFAGGHPAVHGPAAPKPAGEGWSLCRAMRTRIYWGMAQAFFCTATGMFTVIVQLVAFFIDAGYSPLVAATAYGFIGLLSAASVTGSGLLADRFGIRQVVSASFAGSAAGIAILFVIAGAPATALLVAFVPVFGLCLGVRGPIISSICAKEFAGPQVATIYGTIFATNALGAAFGSLMGGVLHDATGGYRTGFVFAIAFIALAVMPFWSVKPLREFR